MASSSSTTSATGNQAYDRAVRMPGRRGAMLSPHQAALPQVRQHQPVERDLVAGEEVRDAAARAELVQGRAVGGQVLLVALQQRAAHRDLGNVVILDVREFQVADDLRLDLFLRQDLNDVDVELPGDEVAQGLLVAALVHQVAEQHDDALAAALDAEGAQRLPQVAGAGRLDLLEEVHQPPDAAPAAGRRHALHQLVVERLDDDAVEVDQADEAQRRGDLLGVVQLGRVAEVHRQAVVDEDVEVQVLLLHEEAQEQLVEAGVEVPVEEAEVVADDVVAVVGELDALPLLLAAPLALHAAHEDFPRHQLQLFEPGQEFGVEQGLGLGFGHEV